MSLSPFTKIRLEKASREENSVVNELSAGARTEYELQLFQLKSDIDGLKGTESLSDRAKLKAELLPKYDPWLDGVLTSEHPQVDDQIFVTCLIWHIDAGLLDRAIELAKFALIHKFFAPDQHKRSLPCIIAEEMALQIIDKTEVDLDLLMELDAMLLSKNAINLFVYDMPDPVRARWLRAVGLAFRESQPGITIARYKAALELDGEVGVKTDLKVLEKQLLEKQQKEKI